MCGHYGGCAEASEIESAGGSAWHVVERHCGAPLTSTIEQRRARLGYGPPRPPLTVERWNIEAKERWNIGAKERWNAGTLELRDESYDKQINFATLLI